MEKPLVGIVLGSDSDLPVMEEAARILDDFGVPYEMTIASAHRSPDLAAEYARTAEERGLKLLIAGAGMAAHLPGVLAAYTCLPVIGVPLQGGALNGVDALYSIVQMPPGVPVAAVAINGARNAALLAVQILGLGEPLLRERFRTYKEGLVESVARKAEKLKERM
ncbi:phosphoribosylaminoimidazole carboxylase catalytic subunit PurE [Thermacetogenium phaeum DSM 12270]|jgi:5-(carboxyamino)imidazole ribonucleotide mutase|uniref:N5-carboxyaminoimidazole ribonucleotide mutase n=1 Tax=Thermacetogenium phaeum (strain ATCC BAA-254 / DSM 26808 / PB) TaxID=1089553 RepID=K4LG59_THEPS|nr:5-(carboxyamino)imidazole ribonucleotide mutase [Thermacetogenium phaeum]AFV11072.1 phosphoribosylaminoimidazole carboxylase catalytic subunit PurE [Thermacetogenium phaeum DSM 12270]